MWLTVKASARAIIPLSPSWLLQRLQTEIEWTQKLHELQPHSCIPPGISHACMFAHEIYIVTATKTNRIVVEFNASLCIFMQIVVLRWAPKISVH